MWPTSDDETKAIAGKQSLFSDKEDTDYHKVLEWSGCVCGVIGAFLVSMPSPSMRFYGFAMFAISNIFLAAWALKRRAWGVLSMQCIYMVSTVIGLINNV